MYVRTYIRTYMNCSVILHPIFYHTVMNLYIDYIVCSEYTAPCEVRSPSITPYIHIHTYVQKHVHTYVCTYVCISSPVTLREREVFQGLAFLNTNVQHDKHSVGHAEGVWFYTACSCDHHIRTYVCTYTVYCMYIGTFQTHTARTHTHSSHN